MSFLRHVPAGLKYSINEYLHDICFSNTSGLYILNCIKWSAISQTDIWTSLSNQSGDLLSLHCLIVYIENTMLVSFDIKFIRQDQKQHMNGEACQTSPMCFWSSLINLISKDTYVVFYLLWIFSRFNAKRQQNKNSAEYGVSPACPFS